jgi:hypothetical protein
LISPTAHRYGSGTGKKVIATLNYGKRGGTDVRNRIRLATFRRRADVQGAAPERRRDADGIRGRGAETMFGKTREDAIKIMLTVHKGGIGVCGVYSAEDAGNLVKRVRAEAAKFQHPLKCAMERD